MDTIKQKVTLHADGKEIAVLHFGGENDYISLTDIAKFKNPDDAFIVINNWMRSKDTILFLGLWEQLYNPDFKPLEFDRFKNEAGANAFTLSPQKWIASKNHACYEQLIVLVNLESMNAELIKLGLTHTERALRLNKMAIGQMTSLTRHRNSE